MKSKILNIELTDNDIEIMREEVRKYDFEQKQTVKNRVDQIMQYATHLLPDNSHTITPNLLPTIAYMIVAAEMSRDVQET